MTVADVLSMERDADFVHQGEKGQQVGREGGREGRREGRKEGRC